MNNIHRPYVKEYQKSYKTMILAGKMWCKTDIVEEQKLLEDIWLDQKKLISHALYYLSPYYNEGEILKCTL